MCVPNSKFCSIPRHKKLLSKCPSSDGSRRHICISMSVVPILICRAISHLTNLLRNECLASFFLDKGTEMDLLPSHSFLRNHTSVSLIIFDCALSFFYKHPFFLLGVQIYEGISVRESDWYIFRPLDTQCGSHL